MTQLFEVAGSAPATTAPGQPPRNVAQLGQPHELVTAITAMVEDLPSLQDRYRRALAAQCGDDEPSLVDAWYDFHRQLTMVRYHASPNRRAGDEPPDQDPLAMAAALLNTRSRLGEAIESAEARRSSPAAADQDELLRRWHQSRYADQHLRLVVRYVLEHLFGSTLDWVRTLADMIADYLAAEQTLSRACARYLSEGTAFDLVQVAALLTDVEHRRDAIEVLVVVAPEPSAPEFAHPSIATGDAAPEQRLRHDVSDLLDRYPALLQRCRQTMSQLTSPARAVVSSRVDLVMAWGHYDDMLTELRRHVAPASTDALPAPTADDVRRHCDVALRQRERVISCLEAARHILDSGRAIARPDQLH